MNQPTQSSPYDIWRRDPLGAAVWMETVTDIAAAKSRILHLAERFPGAYLIFHRPTACVVGNFHFKHGESLSFAPVPAQKASAST